MKKFNSIFFCLPMKTNWLSAENFVETPGAYWFSASSKFLCLADIVITKTKIYQVEIMS